MNMRHFVEIHTAGGAVERHEIVGSEAVIGSGATSGIRPERVEAFHAEHLRLAPTDAGCRVSLMPGVGGLLVYGGAPQWEVLVPWGDEVFHDGARFTFLVESDVSKRPSPVLLGAAALILTLAAVFFVRSSQDDDVSRRELEPPALLEKAVVCGDSDSGRADALAGERERTARAKEERSAFSIADGAEALSLLGEAEACYRVAGKPDDAERLKVELLRWIGQMNEDYAAARLRLRLALEHQRWRDALDTVQHLNALLVGHPPHPYTDWLNDLRHELERKIAVNAK